MSQDSAASAVTFNARGIDGTYVTLLSVLALVAPFTRGFRWTVCNLETAAGPAEEFFLSQLTDSISAEALLAAAFLNPQVVDGRFEGSGPSSESIELLATRDAHWDVYSDNSELLDALRAAVAAVDLV